MKERKQIIVKRNFGDKDLKTIAEKIIRDIIKMQAATTKEW